ncbi:MAG: EAL domain-containing protein [Lachnospira sp.]
MDKIYNKLEKLKTLQCIKQGLIMIMPILIVGAFSLLLNTLPIDIYQKFIHTYADGFFYDLFNTIYNASFGFISVYMCISISVCMVNYRLVTNHNDYSFVFTSLLVFAIFSGVMNVHDFNVINFGAQGVFTALLTTILTSLIYKSADRIYRKRKKYIHGVESMESTIHHVLFSLPIVVFVVLFFAILASLFFYISGVDSLQELLTIWMDKIFIRMGRNIITAALFVFIQTFLWFFGIHGNNVLEPVCQRLFVEGMNINKTLIASGQAPTEIFSKTFLDVFVLMGGSGTTLCLLIAILLFSKNTGTKKLARLSGFPMLFNINEVMTLGLPIVFNPLYFIPFIITPLVMLFSSYIAVSLGLVPIAVNTVEWTTPIIIGGYAATGSIAGSLLQIFNLIIGTLIYMPFVKIADTANMKRARGALKTIVDILSESEDTRKPVELLSLKGEQGMITKRLASEISYNIDNSVPDIYYQPQYDNEGKCIGAEALFRWNHKYYGNIYPPLVFKIAEECDNLDKFEKQIFKTVFKDMDNLVKILGHDAKISINATGYIIQTDDFYEFLKEMKSQYPEYCENNIMIEVTEQAYLHIDDEFMNKLKRIHDLGFKLGIDDFSMGSTSIKYLQYNVFDIIKLDGSITKAITNNDRSKDIITSISGLAHNFNINILAEYVENEQQRKMLEEAGCYQYQGYLYSPAVPLDKLEEMLQ